MARPPNYLPDKVDPVGADIVSLDSQRNKAKRLRSEKDISVTGGGGGVSPPGNSRKSDAKRHNEMLKVFAGFMNSLGAGTMLAGVIVPLISDPVRFVAGYSPVWYFIGLGLHVSGQAIMYRGFRSEE